MTQKSETILRSCMLRASLMLWNSKDSRTELHKGGMHLPPALLLFRKYFHTWQWLHKWSLYCCRRLNIYIAITIMLLPSTSFLQISASTEGEILSFGSHSQEARHHCQNLMILLKQVKVHQEDSCAEPPLRLGSNQDSPDLHGRDIYSSRAQ